MRSVTPRPPRSAKRPTALPRRRGWMRAGSGRSGGRGRVDPRGAPVGIAEAHSGVDEPAHTGGLRGVDQGARARAANLVVLTPRRAPQRALRRRDASGEVQDVVAALQPLLQGVAVEEAPGYGFRSELLRGAPRRAATARETPTACPAETRRWTTRLPSVPVPPGHEHDERGGGGEGSWGFERLTRPRGRPVVQPAEAGRRTTGNPRSVSHSRGQLNMGATSSSRARSRGWSCSTVSSTSTCVMPEPRYVQRFARSWVARKASRSSSVSTRPVAVWNDAEVEFDLLLQALVDDPADGEVVLEALLDLGVRALVGQGFHHQGVELGVLGLLEPVVLQEALELGIEVALPANAVHVVPRLREPLDVQDHGARRRAGRATGRPAPAPPAGRSRRRAVPKPRSNSSRNSVEEPRCAWPPLRRTGARRASAGRSARAAGARDRGRRGG